MKHLRIKWVKAKICFYKYVFDWLHEKFWNSRLLNIHLRGFRFLWLKFSGYFSCRWTETEWQLEELIGEDALQEWKDSFPDRYSQENY